MVKIISKIFIWLLIIFALLTSFFMSLRKKMEVDVIHDGQYPVLLHYESLNVFIIFGLVGIYYIMFSIILGVWSEIYLDSFKELFGDPDNRAAVSLTKWFLAWLLSVVTQGFVFSYFFTF